MDGRGGRCDRREVGGRPGDSRMAAAAVPGTPPPAPREATPRSLPPPSGEGFHGPLSGSPILGQKRTSWIGQKL